MEIKTIKEFEKAIREYDAAQMFFTSSDDPDEIKRAGDKVSELEAAFETCPFDIGEDNIIHDKAL